jgi:DNA-binding Lrp family transcriptional regulator
MACGYVLVEVAPTSELEVYGALLKLKMITEVCPVLGPVDFILKVHADDLNEIAMLVIKHIRTIPGVTSTKTFVEDEFLKHLSKMVE